MENISFFLDALKDYQYLQNAMMAGALVGIICGIMGCFIILRGMALMGDAISHAVLPGVVIAYMLGFSFFIGAVISGVITALGIGYISQNTKIKDDTAIGIMFTAAFALGIVLITSLRGTDVHLWHILFGNVLAVSHEDLQITFIIGGIVLSCIVIFYKQFLLSSFDPIMAQSIGMPTKLIHYFLMLLLSLVTVAALSTVGIVLVVAMLITPGATAFLLTNRLPKMLVISAIVGVISSVLGVYYSFIYDVATGGCIVLVASIIFAITFFIAPKQGLIVKWLSRKKIFKHV